MYATWKSDPMRKIYNQQLDLVADSVFTLAGLLRLFSWQSWPWVTFWNPWPINIVFSWAVYCQDSATFIKVRRGQTFLFGMSSWVERKKFCKFVGGASEKKEMSVAPLPLQIKWNLECQFWHNWACSSNETQMNCVTLTRPWPSNIEFQGQFYAVK